MTVELRPLGVACNIGCKYCYQEPQREAFNLNGRYDLELMKQAVMSQGGPFTLFGGEPLLMPYGDLEELWSWGLESFGSNGIQTNGSLITPRHVELFGRYKVHVGLSIDGPGELNAARWAGTAQRTLDRTRASERAIRLLCDAGMAPSLIITLTRCNAAPELLPAMGDWLRELESMGVTSARLHLLELEYESLRTSLALSKDENVGALLYFESLGLERLCFDMFDDMLRMLMGRDKATTCVWNACDPYTTRAVQGVEGRGQRSNCGRTNKDGVDFVKADTAGFERYVALYHTPQVNGGCQGCRFFLMCKGQCPGTSIDGDWRNRTEHCDVLKALYRHLEERLVEQDKLPLSVQPLRHEVERHMLEGWRQGDNRSIEDYLTAAGLLPHQHRTDASGHGDQHGDHYDGRAH